MAIPERIAREAREAEAQMAQIRNGVQPTNPTPTDTPPVDEPPTDQRSADDRFGVGQVVQPVASDTPPDTSGPVDGQAYAALQQRLATLEGNFSKQNTQLAEARGRAETLERMLERRVEERPTAPSAPAPVASLVSDGEVEEYGADLTDFVRRLVKEGVQAAVTPLLDQMQQINAKLATTDTVARHGAQVGQMSLDDRYVERMNQLVKDKNGKPDWDAINTMHERGNSAFVDWLNQNGEDSDEPRLNIIQRAFARRDADRCAHMINRFKQSAGMADGTAAPVSTDTTATAAAALVSPSTTGSGQTAPSRGRPVKTYTKDDIDRHYEEKVKGKWKGREAKWQETANDMDKAAVEGRFTVDAPNQRGR